MYVVVPICCFCEKVQDGGGAGEPGEQGRWVPMNDYRAKYGLLPEEIWGSHTDCPDCSRQYEQFMAHTHFESVPSLPA